MTAVLVTRPPAAGDVLVGALERRGYRVVSVPTVTTEPVSLDPSALSAYEWVVVTSPQGVSAISRFPSGPRFAAVGQATAAALKARGVDVAYVPPNSNGAALAAGLPDVSGSRIALVRASAAGADLPAILRRRGAIVDEVTAYRTLEGPADSGPILSAALSAADVKAVVFASGSAVRGYVSLGGRIDIPAVTIGPRTTIAARESGFDVIAESAGQSAEALAAAVARSVPLEDKGDA